MYNFILYIDEKIVILVDFWLNDKRTCVCVLVCKMLQNNRVERNSQKVFGKKGSSSEGTS